MVAQQGLAPDSAYITAALTVLAYDGAPGTSVLSRTPTKMPRLGRTLPVHSSCELRGTQSLSCFPNSQINWATFSTLSRAQEAQRLQVEASRQYADAVLADTTVGCTLEGAETQCRRLVYRAPVSRFATGGASNVLIVFYAADRAHERPVLAVCSFYHDQVQSKGLAPLCGESFEVPMADTLMRRTLK